MSKPEATAIDQLHALLQQRIVLIDGATGTQLQDRELTADDFGGPRYEGCNEHLCLTRPDVVRDIHLAYLDAGADIIQTNTFGAIPFVLDEYELGHATREINEAAARLAREAANQRRRESGPWVAGALGPTTKSLSVTGGITFEELADNYAEAIRGLLSGGADLLLFETSLDTLNLKAAFHATDRVFAEVGRVLPMMASVTIEQMGTMLGGQDIDAALVSCMHRPLLSFGMNCSTGPAFMTDHLRTLSRVSPFHTSLVPNAGLPDADGNYNLDPQAFADKMAEFAGEGWLNLAGGCCGTTPEHIRLLRKALEGVAPRRRPEIQRSVVSGMEALDLVPQDGPYFVGERTNSLGSRMFKRMINNGEYERAAEIGRKQARAGAHVLDVCLQNPDRDEAADIIAFLDALLRRTRLPLMIDTTDETVLEAACRRIQGKIIYNSVNLEDGEERFAKIVPLARKYGMALIVGCIDEDREAGMAVTRQRKLEVAERSHGLLTQKYGMAEGDIIFDPLVFPCATGDEKYVGSARETIEGVRLIAERFPNCRTTLGISNVSFGLPAAGREVLNSVFLHQCIEAGLTLPIVNTQKIVRYARISDDDKRLCMDLIDNVGEDPIAAFADHFRERRESVVNDDEWASLPVDKRLAMRIVDGSKEGLTDDLDELLKSQRPLEIINGPLMAGMDEVGKLFNDNELIVAEVLQSAEVMKAAVAHLEPHMDKSETHTRGRIVLATVKGDVHDIGKSLVKIILSNNGYDVIDLGIKVPPEKLIEAAKEHQPNIIGLSGLLVKSAQQMVLTAEDFQRAGLDIPVLVGGAALSDRFTRSRIAPAYGQPTFYARDAMNGLDLANQIVDPDKLQALWEERGATPEDAPGGGPKATRKTKPEPIVHDQPVPKPPDLKLHVLDDYPLETLLEYVNPMMLYGKHLGFKGNIDRAIEKGDETAKKLKDDVDRVVGEMVHHNLGRPRAVYRFFPASADGQRLTLYRRLPQAAEAAGEPEDNIAARFHFPRQRSDKLWSLPDFVRPYGGPSDPDYVAMFVTTCGHGVRDTAEQWTAEGRFFDAHALQALALECAEGFAEMLHQKLRAMWGFADPADTTMKDLFQTRYRGIRMSFGYPACPRLEDQTELFDALDVAESIGVQLTDGYMMDPEASVSAVVFHHPQARYFNISSEDLEHFEREELERASNVER